jgi:hypothetical protein
VINVGSVSAAAVFEVIDAPFDADIGMNPGDDIRIGKTGNIDIGGNAIVRFADMNYR